MVTRRASADTDRMTHRLRTLTATALVALGITAAVAPVAGASTIGGYTVSPSYGQSGSTDTYGTGSSTDTYGTGSTTDTYGTGSTTDTYGTG
jgi:hypothetical protein